MQQQLIVRVRSVYGVPNIYPVNEAAEVFARIAGTKTLTRGVLEEAERLGYSIIVQPEPIPSSVAKWAQA